MDTNVFKQYNENLEKMKEIGHKISEIKKISKIELENKLSPLNKSAESLRIHIDNNKKEIKSFIMASENETLVINLDHKTYILKLNYQREIEMIPISTIDNATQRLMMKKISKK